MNMDTITVHIEAMSFQKSKSQAVTGIIFFDFGSYQFPEKGWDDFVVVVLSWWLSALKNIVFGESKYEELKFMDGPQYIAVKKLSNALCVIECFDKRKGGSAEFTGQYQLTEVLRSVMHSAKATYSVCSQNGWDSDDIDELGKIITQINGDRP
jgi:hypothetical protein